MVGCTAWISSTSLLLLILCPRASGYINREDGAPCSNFPAHREHFFLIYLLWGGPFSQFVQRCQMYSHSPDKVLQSLALPHSYLIRYQSLPHSFYSSHVSSCQFLEFTELFPTTGSLFFARDIMSWSFWCWFLLLVKLSQYILSVILWHSILFM